MSATPIDPGLRDQPPATPQHPYPARLSQPTIRDAALSQLASWYATASSASKLTHMGLLLEELKRRRVTNTLEVARGAAPIVDGAPAAPLPVGEAREARLAACKAWREAQTWSTCAHGVGKFASCTKCFDTFDREPEACGPTAEQLEARKREDAAEVERGRKAGAAAHAKGTARTEVDAVQERLPCYAAGWRQAWDEAHTAAWRSGQAREPGTGVVPAVQAPAQALTPDDFGGQDTPHAPAAETIRQEIAAKAPAKTKKAKATETAPAREVFLVLGGPYKETVRGDEQKIAVEELARAVEYTQRACGLVEGNPPRATWAKAPLEQPESFGQHVATHLVGPRGDEISGTAIVGRLEDLERRLSGPLGGANTTYADALRAYDPNDHSRPDAPKASVSGRVLMERLEELEQRIPSAPPAPAIDFDELTRRVTEEVLRVLRGELVTQARLDALEVAIRRDIGDMKTPQPLALPAELRERFERTASMADTTRKRVEDAERVSGELAGRVGRLEQQQVALAADVMRF